jgi:hypothetical protein
MTKLRSARSERAEIVRHVAEFPDQLGVAEVAARRITRRENAMAPACPGLQESASARLSFPSVAACPVLDRAYRPSRLEALRRTCQ